MKLVLMLYDLLYNMMYMFLNNLQIKAHVVEEKINKVELCITQIMMNQFTQLCTGLYIERRRPIVKWPVFPPCMNLSQFVSILPNLEESFRLKAIENLLETKHLCHTFSLNLLNNFPKSLFLIVGEPWCPCPCVGAHANPVTFCLTIMLRVAWTWSWVPYQCSM